MTEITKTLSIFAFERAALTKEQREPGVHSGLSFLVIPNISWELHEVMFKPRWIMLA